MPPNFSTGIGSNFLGILWCLPGKLAPAVVSTGAAPQRVSISSGKESVSQTNLKSPKRTPKPKNRTNSAKEFSEQFEGVTGHYPIEQGF